MKCPRFRHGSHYSKLHHFDETESLCLIRPPKLAGEVFEELIKEPRVTVDMVACNTLVEGHCRLRTINPAKEIIKRMKENGFYVATYGSFANGIALARKTGKALLLWNEVKERCEVAQSSTANIPLLKPDEEMLDALADICARSAFFKKALEIVAFMEENGLSPNKTKYTSIYIDMHSRMFTSKHVFQARRDRRRERKRTAEAFKFWLGLPNS